MYETHKFVLPLSKRLPSLIVLGMMTPLMIFFAVNTLQQLWTYSGRLTFTEQLQLYIAVIVIVPLMGFGLVLVVPILVAYATTSYLSINPDGIEYNFHPVLRYQCAWSDLDRVGIRGNQYVLFIRESAEITGNSVCFWLIQQINPSGLYCLSLSIFDEWASGDLPDTLRDYAPHLFR